MIHVAGIDLLWRSSERSIRDSVRNALALANARGFRSIALPLIGAGSGGGNEKAIEAMIVEELGQLQGEVRVVRYSPSARKRSGLS